MCKILIPSDLNPIEYVWKDIKHAVRCANTQGTAEFVEKEATRIMNSYTAEQWKKHLDHVIKLEEKYWTDDGFYERFLDTIEESQRIRVQ